MFKIAHNGNGEGKDERKKSGKSGLSFAQGSDLEVRALRTAHLKASL